MLLIENEWDSCEKKKMLFHDFKGVLFGGWNLEFQLNVWEALFKNLIEHRKKCFLKEKFMVAGCKFF